MQLPKPSYLNCCGNRLPGRSFVRPCSRRKPRKIARMTIPILVSLLVAAGCTQPSPPPTEAVPLSPNQVLNAACLRANLPKNAEFVREFENFVEFRISMGDVDWRDTATPAPEGSILVSLAFDHSATLLVEPVGNFEGLARSRAAGRLQTTGRVFEYGNWNFEEYNRTPPVLIDWAHEAQCAQSPEHIDDTRAFSRCLIRNVESQYAVSFSTIRPNWNAAPQIAEALNAIAETQLKACKTRE